MIHSSGPQRISLWIGFALLALSTVHTKTAGALWLFGFFAAALIAYRSHPWADPDDVDHAARTILVCASLAWLLWIVSAAYWGELIHPQSAEINAGSRLFTGALALWWLVRARALSTRTNLTVINLALTLACALALGTALLSDRGSLPTNAIAWACGVGLLVCVLLPWALEPTQSRRRRWLWGAGAALGLGAILASQSRSAYPVLVWALVLVVMARASRAPWTTRQTALAFGLSALLGIVIAFSASLASDPLRLRAAWTEVNTARATGNFNSSVGARYYLLELGWQNFSDSPWLGVGAGQRKALIHAAGIHEPPDQARLTEHVRELKHVHNAYLHHAMDGGVVSLAGFVLTIGGLIAAGWRFRKKRPVAAWQLWGIAFVHATTNLSSVNLAHNYYAVMLALSSAIVLIQARASPRTATPHPA